MNDDYSSVTVDSSIFSTFSSIISSSKISSVIRSCTGCSKLINESIIALNFVRTSSDGFESSTIDGTVVQLQIKCHQQLLLQF